MEMEKIVISFVFLVFLFSFSSAQVAVTISSPQGEDIALMFENEVSLFFVDIVNLDKEPVNNLVLELSVDDELILIDGFGFVHAPVKVFSIGSLSSGEAVRHEFFVKALSPSANAKIFANFGINNFTNLSATFVQVIPSPVFFDVLLEKQELDLGESSSAIVSVRNVSDSFLSFVELSLISDETLFVEESVFSFASLPSNDSIEQGFSFYPKETIQGEKDLLFELRFVDQNGRLRVLQKTETISIQNRFLNLALAIFVIILLLVLAFWGLKQHSSKVKVKGTG